MRRAVDEFHAGNPEELGRKCADCAPHIKPCGYTSGTMQRSRVSASTIQSYVERVTGLRRRGYLYEMAMVEGPVICM